MMLLNENGKIGINNVDPGEALDIVGNLKVQGDITAETLIISSSVTNLTTQFASGSTRFGDTQDDLHEFTGSLRISGSRIDLSDAKSGGGNFSGSMILGHGTTGTLNNAQYNQWVIYKYIQLNYL